MAEDTGCTIEAVEQERSELKDRPDFFSEITKTPAILQQSYFPSLDGLRGLSILLVIAFHSIISMGYLIPSFKSSVNYSFANLGVQVFFVLSGFLITTLLLKEKVKSGNISLRSFYIRRFFRIIPVAHLYLVMILALNFIFNLKLHMLYIAASFLFVRNVFEVATGANNLTAHYWSLAVEEQFYLIFPAILKKSLRTYLYFLFLVLAICFVSGLAGSNVLAKMTDNTYVEGAITIISEFQGIAIGSLFSILIFKGKLTDLHKGGGYKMPAFIILVVLLSLYTGNYFAIFSFFKCICIAMIIVIGLHYDDNIFFKILNHKTLKFIGVLSFSIYIWQQPFTLGLSFINQSTFINRFNNKMMADVVILVILLATLGVISYLSYHFYEKRFLALKNKFKNKG